MNLSEIDNEVMDKIVKKIIELYIKTYPQSSRIFMISSSPKENL
jgi:hypothetical protein